MCIVLDKCNLFNSIDMRKDLLLITIVSSVGLLGLLIFALIKIISLKIMILCRIFLKLMNIVISYTHLQMRSYVLMEQL